MHEHQLHGDAKTHEIITLYKFNAHKALGPDRRRRSARVTLSAPAYAASRGTGSEGKPGQASTTSAGSGSTSSSSKSTKSANSKSSSTKSSSTTSSSTKSAGSDHSQGNSGTSGTYNQPQPYSQADQNNTGANDTSASNQYKSTRDGSPSGNGNGDGKATGKPCAGCVGKAQQEPQGSVPQRD